MKEWLPFLRKARLFAGVGDEALLTMLSCLKASLQRYSRGDYVLRQGDYLRNLNLLIQGRLHIQREDYWGNLGLLQELRPGELFGEAYAVPDSGPLLNDVIATQDSVILSFDSQRVLSTCPSACPYHTQLIKNLFYTISERNRSLVQKLGYLSQRSIRDKLLAYLSDQAQKQNSSTITLPFNRQQLADFIAVDRSALSNQLAKLRREGVLDYKKNEFTLHVL